MYECGNAAARRPYRTTVDDLRIWLASRSWLIEPTVDDVAVAWSDYRAARYDAGIVDLVSFAVMRRLGMSEAFTNDKHFAAAWFSVLF